MKFLQSLKGIVNGISLNSNLYTEEIKKNEENKSSPYKRSRDIASEQEAPPLKYTAILPKHPVQEVENPDRYRQADCFIPAAVKDQLPIMAVSEDEDIIRSEDIPSEAKSDDQ